MFQEVQREIKDKCFFFFFHFKFRPSIIYECVWGCFNLILNFWTMSWTSKTHLYVRRVRKSENILNVHRCHRSSIRIHLYHQCTCVYVLLGVYKTNKKSVLMLKYYFGAFFWLSFLFLLAVRPRSAPGGDFRPLQYSKVNILFTRMMKLDRTGIVNKTSWTSQTGGLSLKHLSPKFAHCHIQKIDLILWFFSFNSILIKSSFFLLSLCRLV